MAGLWPRTGNVTVTNGSKIVTGFGTKWKTGTLPIQKGHTFYGPDNFAYEVDTVVSDESLTLVEAYRGGTLANQGYRIDITRTSTISQFAADLASLVAKYRAWFDGMMTWLTGSGDVAILNPDTGANVTIPSWKKVASEGEGQTARAKVEADRAKTEADRAVTEADRAAGIVAAAALPLPDVWAPFSDSLRLITGYGREVKVGEDVVARMVNFSRSTTKAYQGKDGLQKTVAINEAAFGIGGCLVEGQSANVVPYFDNFSSYISKPTVTTPESDGFTVFDLDQVAYTGSASSLTVGAIYTISALVDVSGPCVMRIGFGGQNRDVTISAAMRGVISLSANCESNAGALCRIGPTSRNAGVRVRVRYLQLEALPFASSPIPTNGAAVTRAADAIQIPYAGNGVPLSDMQMTMSAVIKTNPRPGEPTALIDAIDITPNVGVFLSASGQIDIRIFDVQWNPGITPDMTKEQVVALSFNGATGAVAMRVGDKVVTGTVVVPKGISRSAGNIGLLCRSGTNTRTGFGSVRDFKIWHKFFTVDQLKAIK
ncbi:phage head spike fiber domain-containing protein [Aeromonas caviae]|uniref:phage head spike fiber domain-containing protein n=1 Tax=Aeromonas caviae TaxID=648 RepID=UPI002B4678E2|nr:hypothetical protein [Aeromonas caviae]